MMNAIAENQFIERLTRNFRRSPGQQNRLQETDAEILTFSQEYTLAVTIDSIVEEIKLGIYTNPYLIGWMSVMVNLSDLAAVGAQPLGLLLSEVLPAKFSDDSLRELQQGIQDACTASDTFILGGDTNFGDQIIITGTAVGKLGHGKFLSRVGCKPGDSLYATNLLGNGNAFVLSLKNLTEVSVRYQPVARLKEGHSLINLATACIDTSDGCLATLDQLMRLNNVGFELKSDWESSLDPAGKRLAEACGIPAWFLLAGHHGEFELLFTIPEECKEELSRLAREGDWYPIHIGEVIEECAIYMPLYSNRISLDTEKIRNLAAQLDGNLDTYIKELLMIDEEMRRGKYQHDNN